MGRSVSYASGAVHVAYSHLRLDEFYCSAYGSQSAKRKLRQVSGKEARRVKHINHETSKAIVAAAVAAGARKIVLEDLTHIRARIKTGKRMRARLHRWAWRQLQTFVEYKAKACGIAVEDWASARSIASSALTVVCGRTAT